MSLTDAERPQPDSKAVRRAARALLRAAGYNPATVTYLATYPDKLRVHTIGPDGTITPHVHRLADSDGMSWTERR